MSSYFRHLLPLSLALGSACAASDAHVDSATDKLVGVPADNGTVCAIPFHSVRAEILGTADGRSKELEMTVPSVLGFADASKPDLKEIYAYTFGIAFSDGRSVVWPPIDDAKPFDPASPNSLGLASLIGKGPWQGNGISVSCVEPEGSSATDNLRAGITCTATATEGSFYDCDRDAVRCKDQPRFEFTVIRDKRLASQGYKPDPNSVPEVALRKGYQVSNDGGLLVIEGSANACGATLATTTDANGNTVNVNPNIGTISNDIESGQAAPLPTDASTAVSF